MATRNNNNNKTTQIQYDVFSKPTGEIIIPEFPYSVRNNCQVGQWTDGEKELGNQAVITVVKFSKFFGSLGQTENTTWGQLWFLTEEGCLPQKVILCTYIKGASLTNFCKVVTQVQASKLNPAEGLFTPTFVKKQANIIDDNGMPKLANYYVLEWDWQERSDDYLHSLEELNQVMASDDNRKNLCDLDGSRQMICIDGLPPEQIYQLQAGQATLALPGTPELN